MTKKTKRYLTFTQLMKAATNAYTRRPEVYEQLCGVGPDFFIKGWRVRMGMNSSQVTFSVRLPNGYGGSSNACNIWGTIHNDRVCTVYEPTFSASQYRRRIEEVAPFRMMGKPSYYEKAEVQFLNSDGSWATNGCWFSQRRGRPGRFGTSDGRFVQSLMIDDETGKFVSVAAEREAGRSIDHPNEYSRPEVTLGLLPGTCLNPIDWYDSLNSVGSGLRPASELRLMAARTHAEAVRISKKFPNIKVALIPMCSAEHNRQTTAFGHRPFSEGLLNPEVVVYWPEKDGSQTELHSIRVFIPASDAGSDQVVSYGGSHYYCHEDKQVKCKPESAFTSIEERELLDSLPLC